MPPADAVFLQYLSKAKRSFPTQKMGFNGFAAEYRKAAPTGKLLLDTYVETPNNYIYLGTKDTDMDGYYRYNRKEHDNKISLHYNGSSGSISMAEDSSAY